MAAAVCSPVPMFKGDGADLVDRLVLACQQPAAAAARTPLRERELQLFDWSAWEDPAPAAAETTKGRSAKSSSAASPTKKAPAGSASASKAQKRAGSPQQATPPQRKAAACAPVANANNACPAFFASPKPETVPMPTSLLLRAASVRA